jgi:hypothetical protein
MRNGKIAAGWRIDDSDPNRVGMAFLMTPTAIVAGDADAEFIAEARTDLPRALDAFDAWDARVLAWAERLDSPGDFFTRVMEVTAEMRAALEGKP